MNKSGSKKKTQEEYRTKKKLFFNFLTFGILLTLGGIVFQINQSVYINRNYQFQQAVVDSNIMFLGGFICLVCSYFLLKQLIKNKPG